ARAAMLADAKTPDAARAVVAVVVVAFEYVAASDRAPTLGVRVDEHREDLLPDLRVPVSWVVDGLTLVPAPAVIGRFVQAGGGREFNFSLSLVPTPTLEGFVLGVEEDPPRVAGAESDHLPTAVRGRGPGGEKLAQPQPGVLGSLVRVPF